MIKLGVILLVIAVVFWVVPYLFTIRSEAVGFILWIGCRILFVAALVLIGLGWGLR